MKWTATAQDVRFSSAPTIPTASKADFAFLLHILYMLSDTGTAVVLSANGVLYRGGREGTLRKWMVDEGYIRRVVHVPANTFTDTAIPTTILVLQKSNPVDYIIFEDRETQQTENISIDAIRSNDYLLSVSAYIQKPQEEKPPYNPVEGALELRASMVDSLRSNIELEKFIQDNLGGLTIGPFLDELEEVIKSFR